jgi:hypothetical protein
MAFTEDSSRQATDRIEGKTGALTFNENVKNSGFITTTGPYPEDLSTVELKHNDKSGIKLIAGGSAIIEAPHTISSRSRYSFESVSGDKQVDVARDYHGVVGGRAQVVIGNLTKENQEAAEKLGKLAEQITDTAIAAAKSASDTRVACKVCAMMTMEDDKSDVAIKASQLLDVATEAPWAAGYTRLIELIKKVFWYMAPFRNVKANAGNHNKTKSCGSPGCKNHSIESLQKTMETFGKSVETQLKLNEQTITDLNNKIGNDGDLTIIAKRGIVVQTGLVKNTVSTSFEKGHTVLKTTLINTGSGQTMGVSSKGSPPRMVNINNPLSLTDGDLTLNISDKFTVHSGAGGMDLLSVGDIKFTGSHMHLQSFGGEMHLGSDNRTVISGKNITLIGNDGAGNASINIQSPKVMVEGNLSIEKNLAVKGAVSIDGALWAPFINCLGVKQLVEESKQSQRAAGGHQVASGTVVRNLHNYVDQILKNVSDPTWILNMDNLTSFIQEVYDAANSKLFTLVPDWQLAGWAFCMTYGEGFGIGTTACPAGAGTCKTKDWVWSWGETGILPTTFLPVFLLYHNHGHFNVESGGSVTVPLGSYFKETGSFNKAREVNPDIAMPAPVRGTSGARPGTIGPGGNCGGGGLYTRLRNANFGLADLDVPFNGANFINRYASLSAFDGFLPPITNPNFTLYEYGIKGLSSAEVCEEDCVSTQ